MWPTYRAGNSYGRRQRRGIRDKGDHKQDRRRAACPRCRVPVPEAPALDFRRPPNAAASDRRAVVNTFTAGRQRNPGTHHRTALPARPSTPARSRKRGAHDLCVGGGEWAGAVGWWVFRSFYGFARVLMASQGAQFGGGCLGRVGDRRWWSDTTARGSESLRTRLVWRVAAAFEGHQKSTSRAGASGGGTLQRGVGPGWVARWQCCLWSPLSRIPHRCRRRRTESSRPGGIKSDRYCCGRLSFDLTPPVRNDWQGPPTATRDPGQHLCGKRFPGYRRTLAPSRRPALAQCW